MIKKLYFLSVFTLLLQLTSNAQCSTFQIGGVSGPFNNGITYVAQTFTTPCVGDIDYVEFENLTGAANITIRTGNSPTGGTIVYTNSSPTVSANGAFGRHTLSTALSVSGSQVYTVVLNDYTAPSKLRGFAGAPYPGGGSFYSSNGSSWTDYSLSWDFKFLVNIAVPVLPCAISAITAGAQSACSSNTFTQEVTVTYANAPATGTLDVNGQSFAIGTSPQTVTLTGLSANGLSVDGTASFSDDAGCTLTETGLFTAATACAFSTALNYDGDNDYVESWSSTAGLLPMGNAARTVDFWVNTTQEKESIGNIVAWGNRITSQRSSFAVREGKAAFIGEYRDATGTITINDGIWHHVAISYDGATNTTNAGIKIYVDGVLDPGPYTSLWTGVNLNTTAQPLTMGRTPPPSAVEFFNGSVDEVRIWDKELSFSEVTAILGKSVPVNSANLVAYFDFETGVANGDNSATGGNVSQVIDLTGNYNANVVNFARIGTTSNWVDNNIILNPTTGISLTGNGMQIFNGATAELGNHTNFGKSSFGATVTRTFTITNTGINDLVLNGSPLVSVSGSTDFTITSFPAGTTLSSGSSRTFDVQYASTLTDQFATINIPSSDPSGDFSFEVGGGLNTALSFDGSDDQVSLTPGSLSPTSFSIETWVRFNSFSFASTIAQQTDPISNRSTYTLRVQNTGTNVIYAELKDGNENIEFATGTTSLNTGQWYHVAITYDGVNLTLYLDGAVEDSEPSTMAVQQTTAEHLLGMDYAASVPLNGLMDEVRIWNRALCQAEIQGRMNSSLQGNENGLVAYYDFEEGTPGGTNTTLPSTVYDKAGTNHGTLSGFAKAGSTSNWVAGKTLPDDGLVIGNTFTWNGSLNSNWNTATNWTPNAIPNQCSDVLIPVTTNDPIFGDNQAVNSIEVQSGASLTVSAGGCFMVGSAFTNEGSFVLEATATNYAQYQGPQVEGTLEQVIGEKGWHSIASPFIDAKLGDITFDQGAALNYDPDPLKSNIQYYDPGTWQQTPPSTWSEAWGTWKSALGIQASFDGSVAYNLYFDNYFMSGTFPITMSVSGTFRSMPLTQQLNGANGGWNLMSNPFPSLLSWEKLYDNSDIQPYYYVWDADATNWRAVAGDGSTVPASAQASSTQYIAPYQSVFVRTASGQSTNSNDEADNFQGHLTSNSDKPTSCVDASANPFYKTTEEPGGLRLKAINADYSDEMLIRFEEKYTVGYDYMEDATKFFSMNTAIPSIYTVVNEKACVIASYPTPDLRVESIPLGYSSTKGGTITIEATEIPEGMTVILEDLELKSFHNLETRYAFTTQLDEELNRFKLHVGGESSNINSIFGGDQIVYTQDQTLVFYDIESIKGGKLLLLNIAGQELLRGTVTDDMQIDVSSYAPGIYLIQVNNRGVLKTQRIAIQ